MKTYLNKLALLLIFSLLLAHGAGIALNDHDKMMQSVQDGYSAPKGSLDITTYPYVQNFDDVTPPGLPADWTTVNANADAYAWESFAGNADTEPNSMRIRYNSTLAMDDWLLTPPMVLSADKTYIIRFAYSAKSADRPEALSLYSGSTPTAAGMTNLLFENNNITNTTYEKAEVIFSPATDGTYYLGFHGHSAANMFHLYLDSFSIEEAAEAMDPPTSLAAEVIENSYVKLSWEAPGGTPQELNDDFESYDNFAIEFSPWVNVDVDQSDTYGFNNSDWLNEYAPQAFIVFNPSAANPPITNVAPHSGSKMAASFAAVLPPDGTGPNNDWLITPLVAPVAGDSFNFFARTYNSQYGLERFNVGVSTGSTDPADFTIISGASYIQAPVAWTLYSYDLSAYAGQNIRLAIQCVSNDAWAFLVDDVSVGAVPTTKESFASEPQSGDNARATGIPAPAPKTVKQDSRDLLGYKVYRDGALVSTINDVATLSFEDHDVTVGTYNYTVTAVYTAGESDPAGPVTATIHPPLDPPEELKIEVDTNDVTLSWKAPGGGTEQFNDGFEAYSDFALTFAPWITVDVDQSVTYGMEDVEWPNSGVPQAYIIFNPSATTPPATAQTHSGSKMAACLAAVLPPDGTGPNNDWLISPQVTPVAGDFLSFFAKSHNSQYGLERFNVGVSIGGTDPADFTIINGANYIQAPVAWTQYNYDLTAYAGQEIRFAIQCVSNNAFIFFVDDVSVGAIPVAKESPAPVAQTLARARVMGVPGPAEGIVGKSGRALTGFKIYRDGTLISTITDPLTTTFKDMDRPNGTYIYGVTAVYDEGESVPVTDTVTVYYVANDDPGIPALVTELQGNYPNPFNPSTTIRYSVKETSPVSIGIYNVKGQLVKTLVNEEKTSGNHYAVWNGLDNNNQPASSGVYFYKMRAGTYSSTKKMIMMK